MSHPETRAFRANPRTAWQIVGLTSVLLVLLIFALSQASDPGPLQAALAITLLVGLIAVFGYIALRPPIQLCVGADGLTLPLAWRTPLAWQDIRSIRRKRSGPSLQGKRDWLVVQPKAGVIPDYRLRSPRRLEAWNIRKFGVRIPLHGLSENGDEVVAAIRNHFPFVTEDVG
jgi:hypothetical protein